MSKTDYSNARQEQDISAKELMENFGLTEEQAVKLAAALPAILKEMMAQGAPAPMMEAEPKKQDSLTYNDIMINLDRVSDEFLMILHNPVLCQLFDTYLKVKLANMKPPAQIKKDAAPTIRCWKDSLTLDIAEDTIKLEDGILTADCTATAAMVQDYDGKPVLKDPAELKKACDFARQLPITDQHPEDGMVTDQSQIKGWTTPVQYDEKTEKVKCGVSITDGTLIEKIQKGKKDVSIGFFCDLEDKEGNFKGKKFTAIQRNIVLNHLAAGIDKGRCPAGICGIGQDAEAAPEPKTEEERAMAHFKITPEEWDKLNAEEKAKLIEQLPPKGTGMAERKQTEEPKGEDAKKYKCPKCGNEQAKEGPCEKCSTEVEEVKAEGAPEDKPNPEPLAEPPKTEEEKKEDCDCNACPPPKKEPCTKKDEKQKAADHDEEFIGLVDSIMDFNPPQDRKHYTSKTKQDLKDTLVLLRAKADSKAPIIKSDSKPTNKDEAYRRLEKEWSRR